jgi:hypothetical protein
MNLFNRIKRNLNLLLHYSESQKDLAREREIMRRVKELVEMSWTKYPLIPPDRSPYGQEIEKLLKESETLLRKWGFINDTAQQRKVDKVPE